SLLWTSSSCGLDLAGSAESTVPHMASPHGAIFTRAPREGEAQTPPMSAAMAGPASTAAAAAITAILFMGCVRSGGFRCADHRHHIGGSSATWFCNVSVETGVWPQAA